MFRTYSFLISALVCAMMLVSAAYARESYEDYRTNRDKKNANRDKALSEIKTGEREDLMDDLRGAVREEIDQSMNKERKASRKVVNKDKLIDDVKKIVREEIEDAIKVKEKKYVNKGNIEIGGFVSTQAKGLSSSTTDNNFKVNVFPMLNYFFANNFAIGFKGEAQFNITRGTQDYNAGIGPQFVFGLDRKDEICFYTGIYIGASVNSSVTNKYGFRYGNEFGFKFVLTSGVILNVGAQMVFDNSGDKYTGFQNLILPAIGISAWF